MTGPIRSTIHSDLQRVAAKQRELAQAQPRPSRIRFVVRTTGVGESRLTGKKALDFGAYMFDTPSFSFGVEAVGPISAGSLPQATAIVLKYVKNHAGLYTGAEVGFKIYSVTSDIRLKFSLTFEGATARSTEGLGTTNTDAPRGTNYYSGTDSQAAGSN